MNYSAVMTRSTRLTAPNRKAGGRPSHSPALSVHLEVNSCLRQREYSKILIINTKKTIMHTIPKRK